MRHATVAAATCACWWIDRCGVLLVVMNTFYLFKLFNRLSYSLQGQRVGTTFALAVAAMLPYPARLLICGPSILN